MKIAIIGAAGLRTPLITQSILARQERLGLNDLSLMDIDSDRLELIGALTLPIEQSESVKFNIQRTTDAISALEGADFVITTFRVGGIESRIIDESIPLKYGVLGQETTGPGGFAMGIRSIPIILDYVKLMQEHCPNAWLINFANPSGMLTEAIIRQTGWMRIVGICDSPSSMHRVVAAFLNAKQEDVYLDYFGLNHLGWIKRIIYRNQDHLPDLLGLLNSAGSIPGLPFDPNLVTSMKMIPNEYLYYYYYTKQAIANILKSGESRGIQITKLNLKLLSELQENYNQKDFTGMQNSYKEYLSIRGETYMVAETGKSHDLSTLDPTIIESLKDEGYAGVALNLIEALIGQKPLVQILNIPNQGAISSMGNLDVVEVPALVNHDQIRPIAIGEIPQHCLGLMKLVKSFEQFTIESAVEGSYQKALLALTIHPLIQDFVIAKTLLNEYILEHKGYFPKLQ